ncbi:MAG: aminopeptidase, partial [Pseudomonadota bacterium]
MSFFGTGCSHWSYILEQGKDQVALWAKARPNQKVLQDQKVAQEDKDKIRKIEEYRTYFYNYWGLPERMIYVDTIFLPREEVSTMVVVAPFNEVKSQEECFALVGCFPYLGFFSRDSAINYSRLKEKEGWITSITPIYAYSTLGHFDDPIYSSFFRFTSKELAELIFHELFHSIFFVKSETELNENLADFFAEEMAFQYFQYSPEGKIKELQKRKNKTALRTLMQQLIKELNATYQKENP